MFPDKSDLEIAEIVADFFNVISQEYEPLREENHVHDGWRLEYYEVSKMLKEAKKPRSQVKGDILPSLIAPNCDLLAIPLTHLYNKIIESGEWPDQWKSETVITIPKTNSADSLSKCRNLS